MFAEMAWKKKQKDLGNKLLPLAPEDYAEALLPGWEPPLAEEDTNAKTMCVLADTALWMEMDLDLASERAWGDAAANWGQLRAMGGATRTTAAAATAALVTTTDDEDDDDALYVPDGVACIEFEGDY